KVPAVTETVPELVSWSPRVAVPEPVTDRGPVEVVSTGPVMLWKPQLPLPVKLIVPRLVNVPPVSRSAPAEPQDWDSSVMVPELVNPAVALASVPPQLLLASWIVRDSPAARFPERLATAPGGTRKEEDPEPWKFRAPLMICTAAEVLPPPSSNTLVDSKGPTGSIEPDSLSTVPCS